LVELGFHQGGPAGYGLRRQLVDKDGNSKGLLTAQQHKSIHTDRVILIPGPESEVAVIADIYKSFIALEKGETAIAADLNARGLKTDLDRPWTRESIHQILINPKYIGANVFNRHSFKLKGKKVRNPPAMWILREHSFGQIVSTGDFQKVQAIIHKRYVHWTDRQMLDGLRALLKSFGRLSAPLINEAVYMPSSAAYARRFGGLARAYSRIGWRCSHDLSFIEAKRGLKSHHGSLVDSIVENMKSCGATIRSSVRNSRLTVNEEFTVSIRMAQCHQRSYGHEWIIRFNSSQPADISLVVRLKVGNESILDYYVFPSIELLEKPLRLTQYNPVAIDAYRFENLSFFLELCRQTTIGGVA